VRLRISDNGKGFDPARVPDGHLGLAGMQARAARIGATFSCQSEIGKGTTIEVVVEDPANAVQDARLGEMPSGSIRDR
jgi:signal transduction histidine kinase